MDRQTSLIVGSFGCCEFSVICACALLSTVQSKNWYSKRCFILTALYSAIELPRYVMLIENGSYTSQWAYTCHLIAAFFFYAALSMFCLMLADVLDLSKSTEITSANQVEAPVVKRGVLEEIIKRARSTDFKDIFFVSNFIFFVFVCVGTYGVMRAKTLEMANGSTIYQVYSINEEIFIVFYTFCLFHFAVQLKTRLDQFSSSGLANNLAHASEFKDAMKSVILKLYKVMLICLVASLLRITSLCLKLSSQDYGTIDLPNFMYYHGILWWLMSDFIPRGLTSFAVLYYFGFGTSSKPAKAPSRKSHSSTTSYGISMLQRMLGPAEDVRDTFGSRSDSVFSFSQSEDGDANALEVGNLQSKLFAGSHNSRNSLGLTDDSTADPNYFISDERDSVVSLANRLTNTRISSTTSTVAARRLQTEFSFNSHNHDAESADDFWPSSVLEDPVLDGSTLSPIH